MPLRLIDVKQDIADVVNCCAGDSRVTDYVNQACQRLLYELKAVGTWIRYRVCVNSSCITWPRQIETVEAAALCKRPLVVRNQWYEFLESGVGILSSNSCARGLIDAGEAASFDNIVGLNKKLAVYSDQTEDADAAIILQYYDSNGQWVRTQVDGEWIDGESITLPASGGYAYTSLQVMPNGFVRAIKPKTNGTIRLYQYDTVGLTYKPLAYYEHDEEVPIYRRSTVPNAENIGCCERTEDCGTISLEIAGKIRFIPVEKDNDFLPIAHPGAVRLAAQAVFKEKADKLADSVQYMTMAIRLLTKQLEHHQGHGAVQPMRLHTGGVWGGHVPVLR